MMFILCDPFLNPSRRINASRVGLSLAHDRAFCTSAYCMWSRRSSERELGLPNEIEGGMYYG